MNPVATCCACAGIFLALGGCKESERPPPVRPVLSTVITLQTQRTLGFAGTVEPQYRASLGFRTLGRIVARHANVGDLVAKGALLASLDPVGLELALRTAQAVLSNSLAQLFNATGIETRQRTLLEQNAASQAQFDLAQQGREAAAAAVARARANLAKAQEQVGYAELRSDFDGIVTAVEAEVGQVVSPGQSVMTVVRPDIREAVVDIPEDVDGEVRLGAPFDIALQSDPTTRTTGRVREVAPQADAATRTRRVRITLDTPPPNFRLGTTITATLTTATAPRIEVPASALFDRDGKSMVWVVDPTSKTVSPRDVRVARRGAAAIEIAAGLEPGTRVVIAGVHSLTPGQSVKVPEAAR